MPLKRCSKFADSSIQCSVEISSRCKRGGAAPEVTPHMRGTPADLHHKRSTALLVERKAREKANLQQVRKHDLRHSFASWYSDDPSATMQQLRDIPGHSNLAVTSRYTHLIAGQVMPDSVGLDIDLTESGVFSVVRILGGFAGNKWLSWRFRSFENETK